VITNPAEAPVASLPSPYDVRLATSITEGVDRRLRAAALVRKIPLNRLVDQVLDEALPPVEELAERMKGAATDER
jgi:predicted HicB family RNase H-like nuclease